MRFARNFTLIVAVLALAAGALSQPAPAAQTFAQWVERFWPVARAAGIKRETYDRAFKGMTPDPKVIEAANFQPEYVKPIGEYIDRVVSDKRIATGKQKLEENKALLDVLEKRYGVDRAIIVAIWGVESNYGTQPGDMNVIRSLATLAYYNTKAAFARQQLITALKIVQRGDIPVEQMNGSWAGAMGHTQFIPTTYQSFAVDYDGDGKRNIWYDVPDALASTASYLKHSSWQPGQTWGYEVTLPKGFNPKKVSEKTLRSLGDWQRLGIKRVGGEAFPRPGDRASLFAPAATNGPAFLVLNNFRSILHYNQSMSYALGVGHLSDRLKGYGPFVHPWPTDENHLALDQRVELQKLLVAKGLLVGDTDGIIGPATLEAVKTFQRSKGLPVDGFPSRTILELLRKEG
ncbi:lytic murein transglycosylase [Methyloceanibacter sp.]|uniref:lytic murein transglycosylase n=1 Tax=Methyloceanibacter sp. TaxID=1965321 RepID=UPI003D6C7348